MENTSCVKAAPPLVLCTGPTGCQFKTIAGKASGGGGLERQIQYAFMVTCTESTKCALGMNELMLQRPFFPPGSHTHLVQDHLDLGLSLRDLIRGPCCLRSNYLKIKAHHKRASSSYHVVAHPSPSDCPLSDCPPSDCPVEGGERERESVCARAWSLLTIKK